MQPSRGGAMLCVAHLSLTPHPMSSMAKWESCLDAEQVGEEWEEVEIQA